MSESENMACFCRYPDVRNRDLTVLKITERRKRVLLSLPQTRKSAPADK